MNDKHTRIKTGASWEPIMGYCRAVRAGSIVAVSGTTAVGADGQLVGEGDMYEQSLQCIQIIAAALEKAGCGLADVIRTRIYVTDIDRWEEVARAHSAAFAAAPPASTMVEVSRLVNPDMLVEIEADAVVPSEQNP